MVSRAAGHDVAHATTPHEGVDHLKSGDFDLGVIGHALPAADQQQLTQEIKQRWSTPVIVMSHHHQHVSGADYNIHPLEGPDALLIAVAEACWSKDRT